MHPASISVSTARLRASGVKRTEDNEEKAKNVLRRMTHVNDITPRNFVEVCVDMKQQGIAGFNSWGDRPLPEFTMPANQEYKWGFTLIPVK